MKKIIVLLVVFFYCFAPKAQDEDPPPGGEIFIELIDPPTGWSLEVTVSTENTDWDADDNHLYHYLSENYEGDTKTFTELYQNKLTIDLCYDPGLAPFIIGLGKYKIEFEYDNVTSYFYVDYRTSDLPECGIGGVDISFDYDVESKQFRQNGGEKSINGTTQNFWDHRVYCDQETEDFRTLYSRSYIFTLLWSSKLKVEFRGMG